MRGTPPPPIPLELFKLEFTFKLLRLAFSFSQIAVNLIWLIWYLLSSRLKDAVPLGLLSTFKTGLDVGVWGNDG
jgi:hypothetical protein